MKKLVVLLVIMTASLFSQSWNNVVQTTITFDNLVGLDLVTNKDGNHILVNNNHLSGGFPVVVTHTLRYYLLNSSGSVIRSYTFENFQGGGGIQFASIDGTDDRIYVVYKLWNGNQIKTRKSTNAGQSWTNILDIDIGSNTCNHIDITFGKDDNALHVVWATQDAGSDYKTYYRRLASDNSWSNTQEVTDGSNVGGFPTVSKSQNRVHVSYNTGHSWDPEVNLGDAKSRDKYVNTWQTPQLVFPTESFRERIHAGNSKLFDFYYKVETGMGQYHSYLYVKVRDFESNSWSSPQLLHSFAGVNEIVSASNSFDGKTHIVYEISEGVGYRNYDGSSWSQEEQIGDGYISPRIYSVSNDQYVVWGRIVPNQNIYKVYYRQYDAAPLAPQNPQLSANAGNNKIRISWTKNNEPDISLYEVWRKVAELGGVWQNIGTTTNNYLVDNEYLYAPGAGDFTITYKVRAKDIGNKYSDFSVGVTTRGEYMGKDVTEVNMKEFRLNDNYPNPFNPSTKISWQSPIGSWQTLKVYDILGNEVATLVEEYREAGKYEVEFQSAVGNKQLASGIYFYKLTAGSFTDVKKMILSK